MKKVLKSKRGDISTPVITILLVVASLSIAALVISWLFGVGISASKQASLTIIGTPVLQPSGTGYTLHIILKNTGTADAIVKEISLIADVPVSIQLTNDVIVKAGETKSMKVPFSQLNLGNKTRVNGLVISDSGTIPFFAVVQSP